jgi:hypothetical protein
VNSVFAKRRARIEQLGVVGFRSLPKRAEEEKGRWMGELQMRRFHAERSRDAGLKAADADAAAFAARFAELQGSLETLERHARKFFGGYGALVKMLRETPAGADVVPDDLVEMFGALRSRIKDADAQLAAFRRLTLPRCFSDVPLIVLILLVLVSGSVFAIVLNSIAIAAGVVVALLVLIFVLHGTGFRQAKAPAAGIAAALAEARALCARCATASRSAHEEERRRSASPARFAKERKHARAAAQPNRAGAGGAAGANHGRRRRAQAAIHRSPYRRDRRPHRGRGRALVETSGGLDARNHRALRHDR